MVEFTDVVFYSVAYLEIMGMLILQCFGFKLITSDIYKDQCEQ